ncbi:MAG: cation:proton antiporter, partial [Alphaproteobacteria bacterium]|nr:cation:proton antiporter [Alphaproteobacteria bacterium]
MAHHVDPFLLELFVIFLWAKIAAELFEQFKAPAVLGEILAGIILGPYAARLVIPSDAVESIAQVGAIFLLFSVGLETSPRSLVQHGRNAIMVAMAGILLPFFFGYGFMRLFHNAPLHEALFVAAALVATSVGITARVLGDLGVLQARASRIILGAAVFDDILGMLLLAVVVGIVSGGKLKYFQLAVLTAEALGFAFFMIFIAPRLIHRMRPGLRRMSSHNAPLVIALAICLGLSALAQKVGLAAIIGAFFAGLAFAEYSPEWQLEPRVHALTEFLAPFFFFTMGARLNLTVFTNRAVVIGALVISLIAILTKVIGCGAAVWKEGLSTVLRVGVGMTPRGEVGLIVALIGLQMNMISQGAYAIVLAMTG